MNRTATKNGEGPEVLDPIGPSGTLGEMAALPREMALMKMENDTIHSMALAHPRDYGAVKRDVADQLKEFPSFAREAIYRKPVGKDPETGEQKFARGLSVRAAEAVAEAYGFNRVRTSVDEIPGDDTKVRVTATFTDFQKGRIWEDSGILSKYYKARGGGLQRTPDDRFYSVVAKAEVSRRAREVILRSVPPGLRSELFEMAEKAMASLLTPDQLKKLVANFGKIGVSIEAIERYLGETSEGWTQDHRLAMAEIWNAIKDGETTADAVFAEKPAAVPDIKQEATMDDLTGDASSKPAAVPAEPTRTTDEAQSDPASEPDWPAVAAGFRDQLRGVHSIGGVKQLLDGLLTSAPDMPEESRARMTALADLRITEIKAGRGEGSNAK
jgi:hypothetical protein